MLKALLTIAIASLTLSSLTAEARQSSKIKIVCSAKKGHKVAMGTLKGCSGEGNLAEREKRGNEIILSSHGNDGLRCIITEDMAKKQKIPFQMLWDLLEEKRAEVVCYYTLPLGKSTAAEAFSMRVFLE